METKKMTAEDLAALVAAALKKLGRPPIENETIYVNETDYAKMREKGWIKK